MLVYNAVITGNRNAAGLTDFFYGLLQDVRRNTAHFHPSRTGYSSCGGVQVKQLRDGLCILAVHFKEISDLEKDYIIGMVVFNIVVCVHVLAELPLTGLHFLVLGFFFGGEVSAV